MLHRSFKPAKCKIALRLAIPRLKLMKNKREAHVKQLKRELAQLLESGQDQTARIRVEHVVREEKTVAAYNLVEIYCELIVARMPVIESQKNCPIDLKEAIASVVFASARCEDIPELKDISKHFTAKYGKEFTSAALELRPNCGVGRMLVEKLSANAPDGPTKVKILTAIAEEHNINWDPESFGAKESKIYDDLLNGPNTSMEATKISADPPNIQASPSHYEPRPPNVQVPNYDKGPPNVQDPKHIGKNDAPTSFYDQSSRSSPPHPKSFDYSNNSANNSVSSGTYPPNSKPHGTQNQGMEFRNSYSGNESTFSSPRQHWNMEFKDATAAAQAAAESAERASMAARAAAELSSRGNIPHQYSMESQMSSSHGTRDDEPRKYTGSASQNEHFAGHPVNIPLHGRNSRNYEQTDSNEQQYRAGEADNFYSKVVKSGDKSTHSSFKSTAASFNEKPSAEVSMKRSSGEYGMQFVNELHDIKNPQNFDHHEVRVGEQSSYPSSHSQSNTFTDDRDVVSNLNWPKSENYNSGESRMQFVDELHDTKNSDFADYQEVRIRKQSSYSSSHSHSSTFSDDRDDVSNLNRQQSRNNSGDDSFLNDKGSLQRTTKETTDSYDNASAVFDDYRSDNDEVNFDLEEEHKEHEYSMNFSSPGERSPTHPFTSTNSWSIEQNVESPEKPISQAHIFSDQLSTPVLFESSTSSAFPSHVDDLPVTFDNYGPSSESEEEVDKSKFVRSTNPTIGSHKKNMDSHQAENSIFTPQLVEGMEDNKHSNDSSLKERKELNYGNLTGGLRNKSYGHPPFSKIPRGNALSSGEAANDTSTRIKQSSSAAALEASGSSRSNNQEPYSRKGIDEVNRKLSTRASVTHVDSSDDDSEEERPKQTFSTTSRLVSETKRSSFDGTLKSSEKEQPSTSVPKIVSSGSAKSLKAQTSVGGRSSKENASHVHPKLPDYDTLTAHLNSLRQNRQ
ncbi:hypothetical protein REPUB_Repub18cG0105400 [Reevesia pubescens]